MAKKERTTLQQRNHYKHQKVGLYALTFASPFLVASVHTSICWNDWFNASGGISLPFGLVSLFLTVVASVIAILKSDTIVKKGTIALLLLGVLFIFIGITNLFLASLFQNMGFLWMEAGGGLIGSFVSYTAESKLVEPKYQMYKKLVEDNGLDKKSLKKQKAKEKAEREARERAQKEAEAMKKDEDTYE